MISYKEKKPCSFLEDFIDCFWRFKPRSTQEVHRVTPDNRVDLLFEDGSKVLFSGPMTKYTKANNRNIYGVRFKPEYVYSLFQIPLFEFQDQTIDIDEIYAKKSSLCEAKLLSNNFYEFIENVSIYFSTEANRLTADKRMAAFSTMIESGLPLRKVVSKFGVTEQHLRRLTNTHLGMSPKRFEKVQKLKNLKYLSAQKSVELSSLALAGGYFDQSHLNNDCKEIAGLTPKQFFS